MSDNVNRRRMKIAKNKINLLFKDSELGKLKHISAYTEERITKLIDDHYREVVGNDARLMAGDRNGGE
jgi:hypothetical protein